MIAVEKGMPIPAPRNGGGNQRYPFNKMEVGDSFAVGANLDTKVRSAAAHYGTAHSLKFTSELREENGERVIRVWRVE